MIVLCPIERCIYHILEKDKGSAYQNQCGNDEIEIDMNDEGVPKCYSYEQKEASNGN